MTTFGIGEIPQELKHIPTMSPSRLLDFMESPRYYNWVHNLGNKKKVTKQMDEGRMIHMYTLEREKFEKTYVNYFATQKPLETVKELTAYAQSLGLTVKSGTKKEDLINFILDFSADAPIYDAVLARLTAQGQTLIDNSDMTMLNTIQGLIDDHAWLSPALKGGTFEQMMWFYDDLCEVVWRFKPDCFNQVGLKKLPVVIDLKKTPDTSKEYFDSWLYKSKAYIQFGVYREGCKLIYGKDPYVVAGMYDIAEPCAVEAYHVDEAALSAGWQVARKFAMKFVECKKKNHWPTWGDGKLLTGSLPAWAINKLEYNESLEA